MPHLLALLLLLLPLPLTASPPSFSEHLSLAPLPDAKLHAHFHFEAFSPHPPTHSSLLPLSITRLFSIHAPHALSLSLTRGRWLHERWPTQNYAPPPRGALLAFWLHPSASPAPLRNALAAAFCSSLNNLHLLHNPPHQLFPPKPPLPASLHLGFLPREMPCTENLSSLLSLLPCDARAGLASLIDPHRFAGANYQSLSLNLRHLRPGLKLSIDIHAVFDPVRQLSPPFTRNWNFASIFSHHLTTKCPLANFSTLDVLHTNGSSLEPRATSDGRPRDQKHTYDLLRAVLPFGVSMTWPEEDQFNYPITYEHGSKFEIRRVVNGYGQTRGKIGVEIMVMNGPPANSSEQSAEDGGQQEIMYYVEEFPWWLKIYVHTLSVSVNDVPLVDQKKVDKLIVWKKIRPSVQRKRPYLMYLGLKLPTSDLTNFNPQNTKKLQKLKIKIEVDYEKDLLLYTEYPSDANRGFDINPATLIFPLPATNNSQQDTGGSVDGAGAGAHQFRWSWSTCGLISLATPDFSMPYNVIIVTSTVVALFFGSVFNLLVREIRLVKV